MSSIKTLCEGCKTPIKIKTIRSGRYCKACLEIIDKHRNYKHGSKEGTRRAMIRRARDHRKTDPKKFYDYQKAYYKRKRKDIEYKLRLGLRTRLQHALKQQGLRTRGITNEKLSEYLGCSYLEWKLHLESKFREDMSWATHGKHGWHIDHIKPLASFDLSKQEEICKALHYTNTQPLWCDENWSKSGKILD